MPRSKALVRWERNSTSCIKNLSLETQQHTAMYPEPLLRRLPASAGSGKTFTLVSQFLQYLAEAQRDRTVGCTLNMDDGTYAWPEILAITFTNSAAAEMRDRIIGRLKLIALDQAKELSKEDCPFTPQEAALWLETLLRRYSALNVRTIDSLQYMIVRLSALDLRLAPDFEPVFDTAEAVTPLLDQLLEDARSDGPYAPLLREACQNIVSHSHEFTGFLAGNNVRKRILELVPLFLQGNMPQLSSPEELATHRAELFHQLRTTASTLLQAIKAANLQVSKNLLNALDKCILLRVGDELPSFTMLAKSCLDECLNKVSKGHASTELETMYTKVCRAAARLSTRYHLLRDGLSLAPFITLAQLTAIALPELLKTEGRVPQLLMNTLALEALSGDFGVSQLFCRMGTPLTHLLIDEFQDTSSEQWHMLKPLLLEALSRGGSLTWVGDMKQAIYGWRGGDASLFERIGNDAELLSLATRHDVPPLVNNRRSCQAIVEHNNAVFGQLQHPETAAAVLQALVGGGGKASPTIAIEAARMLSASFADAEQQVLHTGGYVRLDYLEADNAEALDACVREHLLERLSLCLSRRNPGEIAILVRKNKQSNQVATWLMANGIPVVTENSFMLAQHPLIIQLVAMLSFQGNPDDDLAFWTLISGSWLFPPMVELDARVLHDWLAEERLHTVTSRGVIPLFRRFQQRFPAVWQTLLAPFYAEAGLLTAYDATQETLHRFNVLERFPETAAFVRRFIEVLHRAEEVGHGDLAGFLDFWSTEGHKEKAPMPSGLNAVRVITMHKAKGLQFPVVIIPWTDLSPKADDALHPVELDDQLTLLARSYSGMETYHQSKAASAREALHLLYVAWTRPEEELHVFLTATPHMSASSDALLILLENVPLERGTPPISTRKDAPPVVTPCPCSATAPAANDHWRPMHWLPRLKIFRNPLGSITDSPERRGTLAHLCLEHLKLTGSPQVDAARAVALGLSSFPASGRHTATLQAELESMLHWFATLPEARFWLQHGHKEQAIMDAEGNMHRADLVVNDGSCLTVIEYKTGNTSAMHTKQLHTYMCLLQQAQDLPVRGALVYLDAREVDIFMA